MEFTNKQGQLIVKNIIQNIMDKRDELSKIDAAVGDGDHGINMSKGFNLAREDMQDKEVTMSEGFMIISKMLMSKIGGSMGPLYGSFFRGLSIASRDAEKIDRTVIREMLQKSYTNLTDITEATVGDKTLIDVLNPAVNAYEKAYERGDNMIVCLEAMTLEAEAGLEATKNMVAKLGRGSRLGERSLGHQDAGATSCFIILKAFADSAISLVQKS